MLTKLNGLCKLPLPVVSLRQVDVEPDVLADQSLRLRVFGASGFRAYLDPEQPTRSEGLNEERLVRNPKKVGSILGSSWVVISSVCRIYKQDNYRVIGYIRGLITPLATTHEHLSRH